MKRAVKKFLRSVKYNVTFKSTEKFLLSLGYSIVFFGTRSGDAEIKKHGLEYMAETEKAFTYCGQSKIVFLNASLHLSDKFLLLLHETGHILFGHLEKNKHLTRDDIKAEIEADTFAYCVSNPQKPQFVKVLTLFLCLFAVFSMSAIHYKTASTKISIADNVNSVSLFEGATAPFSDETVYITETGHKFHRSTCFSLLNSSIPIPRDEAEENYTPCKLCNP